MKILSRNEKVMLLINCFVNMANAMSAVFVNVYLYAYTESLVTMAIYTIIRIAMFPPFFTLGGKLANKKSFSVTLTFGLIFMMLMLIFVLTANPYFGEYPVLIYVAAVALGVGEGLFYLSNNSLNQIVSTKQTRPVFISLMGIFNNVAGIIAPLLATFIIANSSSDTQGYLTIFKVVIVIYAILVVFGFLIKTEKKEVSFSVRHCLNIKNDKKWSFCMFATFLFGMRDSLILMLAGLLVYNATGGSGSLYSQLLAVFALLTILSYAYCAKKMRDNNRIKLFVIGAVLISSSTIVLVLVPNLYGAVYYGVVNAIATPFYANAYQIITMNCIAEYKDENLTGRVIAKEIYLSMGRIGGMVLIVLCYLILGEEMYLLVAVLFISMFPIYCATLAIFNQKKGNI